MKKFMIEIKWAIIFTIATILWAVLEKSLGLHDEYISKHSIYTLGFVVVSVTIYVLDIMEKKKFFYQGNMTWTQGFLSGLMMTIFIAVLSPLVQYVVFNYISPDFFKNVIAYAVSNKIYTQAAADTYFTLNSYYIQGIVGSISSGVITSAIVALILKSKVENPKLK